jgi:hypothetical protein
MKRQLQLATKLQPKPKPVDEEPPQLPRGFIKLSSDDTTVAIAPATIIEATSLLPFEINEHIATEITNSDTIIDILSVIRYYSTCKRCRRR